MSSLPSLQTFSLENRCFLTVKKISISDCPQLVNWKFINCTRGHPDLSTNNVNEQGRLSLKQWVHGYCVCDKHGTKLL